MGRIFKNTITFSSNLGGTHYTNNTSNSVFKICADGDVTISFSNNLLYNNGSTDYWEYYEADTEIELYDGNTIGFKGSLIPTEEDGIGSFTISGNGTVEISGNLLALINNEHMKPYQFKNLFKNCSKITDAKKLVFPDYTVQNCYEGMFYGCTSLTSSPKLIAETLSNDCYKDMFYGCTSLNNIICYNVDDISEYVSADWVNGVISSGTFEINYNGDWNNTNKSTHIPQNWDINNDYNYPWENEYLTLYVLTSGTIIWLQTGNNTSGIKTISYSTDNGETWTEITATLEGVEINVVSGDKVLFKGNNTCYAYNRDNYSSFTGGTATFEARGNMMSLLYEDNFIGQNTLPAAYALSQVFHGSNIVSAEYLVFPATVLTNDCYRSTFAHCQLLVKSPKILPATKLTVECYFYMFTNCPLMETHPELPAETLINQCYCGIFTGCYNLTTIKCLAKENLNYGANSFTTNADYPPSTSKVYIFIKHPKAVWPTAVYSNQYIGIPSSWVIKNYKGK